MKINYYNYSIKQINNQMLTKSLKNNFIKNGYKEYLNSVYKRTSELFLDNKDVSKALKYHLNQILPCVAFYETLINITGSKEIALDLLDKWAYDELYKISKVIKVIAKIGLYKKIPKLFDYFIDKLYGLDAGFESLKPANCPIFSRDILVCPYNNTCIKYGYPELTKLFCKSDDITYSNIHPKLVWNRTKTIGTNGDCCDFRLYLK